MMVLLYFIFLFALHALAATIQNTYLSAFQNHEDHVIYLDDTEIKNDSKQQAILFYVTDYLERGSNLKFLKKPTIPAGSSSTINADVIITFRMNDNSNRCDVDTQPPVNGKAEALFYWGKGCKSVGDVIEHMLYALGFGKEHLRSDRGNHIFTSLSSTLMDVDNTITTHTPYDVYSITHAVAAKAHGNYGPKNVSLIPASFYSRTFLTPCDWNLLNTVYPGHIQPPACIPNTVVDDLGPALKLVKLLGYNQANWVCLWANRGLFAINTCVRKYTGHDITFLQPNLHWIPNTPVEPDNIERLNTTRIPEDFTSLISTSIIFPKECKDYCKDANEYEQCIARCAVCQQINVIPFFTDCVALGIAKHPVGDELTTWVYDHLQKYFFQDTGDLSDFRRIAFSSYAPHAHMGASIVVLYIITQFFFFLTFG